MSGVPSALGAVFCSLLPSVLFGGAGGAPATESPRIVFATYAEGPAQARKVAVLVDSLAVGQAEGTPVDGYWARLYREAGVDGAVLLARTAPAERRWLPPDHGYPLGLHERVPAAELAGGRPSPHQARGIQCAPPLSRRWPCASCIRPSSRSTRAS